MMAGRLVSKASDGLIWLFGNWYKPVLWVLVGFLLLQPVLVVMIIVHIFFGNVLCPSSNSAVGCAMSLTSSALQYAATALAETARRW